MQRYFVNKYGNNKFELELQDLHHIKNVMRCKNEDKIEVVYDKKVYLCQIKNIDSMELEILNVNEEDRDIPVKLTIAVGLVQEQKFDLILQKLTELGVDTIIPLNMERSIVKLDKNKQEKKMERWVKICKEASEQSHRITIPNITNIKNISDLAQEEYDLKLICSLTDRSKELCSYLRNDVKSILFVIGPEGGISPNEENKLSKIGFNKTTLGKRVLRVETATFCVASIVNYVYKG